MNKPVYRFLSFMTAFALTFGGQTKVLASSPSESALQISNTYYVSTSGNDTNTGTQTAPFKTFAKATSVLVPGDVLQVVTGTYLETLNLAASGTAAAPITVIGNGSVLNMQGINANGITVNGSYIRVAGFEVTGATDFGIFIKGKYVTVENNKVHDAVTINGVGTCGISTSWGSAVKVGVGGENATIRNNTVYNNCGEGIAVTRGVNAVVENNTIYDNFGVNIYIDNSPYTTVQNNSSYCTGTHLRNGNRATGIALGEELYSGWGAQLHDVVVSGNTVRDCRYGISAYESDVTGTLTNVSIAGNNIPGGQIRSISLQTLLNQNISVSYNTIFNDIYVYQPVGVTLTGNTIGGIAPAPTNVVPSATFTALPTVTPTKTTLPSPTPTLIVPTATRVASTATSVSSKTYDSKLSAFVYSSGWQTVSTSNAYGGSYRETTQNGATVTFPFIGQSFSILYKGGVSFSKFDIYLDGKLVATLDEKLSTATYQKRWDYPSQLVSGNHTLKMIFKVTSSTVYRGSLDAVIVR